MALAKMREIGGQMRAEIRHPPPGHRSPAGAPGNRRNQRLIAVSSPHRAAAFDACRYAIDTLKRTVPIWKKEYFVGGAVWAEGEVPSRKPFRPRMNLLLND